MIIGQVNSRNEAIIPIKVLDVFGQLVEVEATVDTGFSGYLTLPVVTIAKLQMLYDRTGTYTLGDNNDVDFELYCATLFWDGQNRSVFVLGVVRASLSPAATDSRQIVIR